MKTKKFDCVEMKRQGALRVHERLKGMTVEQQVEYWRQRSEEFQREQDRLRAESVRPEFAEEAMRELKAYRKTGKAADGSDVKRKLGM